MSEIKVTHNSWEVSTVYVDGLPLCKVPINQAVTENSQAEYEARKEADAEFIAECFRNRRTPTAREPVKVTEAMVAIAVNTWFEHPADYMESNELLTQHLVRMRAALTAALSAHLPEVQPAEPMAKHWREAFIDGGFYCCATDVQGTFELLHSKALELAAQHGEGGGA